MNKYDPFMKVKNDTFLGSKSAIVKLSKYIAEVRANGSLNEKEKKETFVFLLKVSDVLVIFLSKITFFPMN